MSTSCNRILLHITTVSNNDPLAVREADAAYLRINNILSGLSSLPNLNAICACCTQIDEKLGAYIRNECINIEKEDTLFDANTQKPNSILTVIPNNKKGKIRVLLYPGEREMINDLKLKETTHNMIIQFDPSSPAFSATEPHENPPSFYQICSSEDVALLYFEALIVDACLCHYMCISDVASHHDEKQKISSEKVQFIREIYASDEMDFLSKEAKQLVGHVASMLKDTTPYVSFLSIFTIASRDYSNVTDTDCILSFFTDYRSLWSRFQKWYFTKHGRIFSDGRKIENPLDTIFDRNVYQGQISPDGIVKGIEETIKNVKEARNSDQTRTGPNSKTLISYSRFGIENLYAFVIIRHLPSNSNITAKLENLFSGQLHQAKWKIIHMSELDKFDSLSPFLEIVPFMIEI